MPRPSYFVNASDPIGSRLNYYGGRSFLFFFRVLLYAERKSFYLLLQYVASPAYYYTLNGIFKYASYPFPPIAFESPSMSSHYAYPLPLSSPLPSPPPPFFTPLIWIFRGPVLVSRPGRGSTELNIKIGKCNVLDIYVHTQASSERTNEKKEWMNKKKRKKRRNYVCKNIKTFWIRPLPNGLVHLGCPKLCAVNIMSAIDLLGFADKTRQIYAVSNMYGCGRTRIESPEAPLSIDGRVRYIIQSGDENDILNTIFLHFVLCRRLRSYYYWRDRLF